jgi:hypothetical protein
VIGSEAQFHMSTPFRSFENPRFPVPKYPNPTFLITEVLSLRAHAAHRIVHSSATPVPPSPTRIDIRKTKSWAREAISHHLYSVSPLQSSFPFRARRLPLICQFPHYTSWLVLGLASVLQRWGGVSCVTRTFWISGLRV